MNPHESPPRPAPPPFDETVTFGEMDGHAVVRVETTFILRDPDAVAEVLQWIEHRRTHPMPGTGLLGPRLPRPQA